MVTATAAWPYRATTLTLHTKNSQRATTSLACHGIPGVVGRVHGPISSVSTMKSMKTRARRVARVPPTQSAACTPPGACGKRRASGPLRQHHGVRVCILNKMRVGELPWWG